MAEPEQYPLVMWVIPCFDKRRPNPFPVYNRVFFLDWTRLSSDEAAEILAIVSAVAGASSARRSPQSFDTAVVTFSRSRAAPDWQMLTFRDRFYEPTEEERSRRFEEVQRNFECVKCVQANAEYFEDENGRPISDYEMIQHVSGQEDPIIVGDSKCVTRLGPVPPKAASEWNKAKSTIVAHFLDVVRRIASSSWFQSPQSITYLAPTHKSANDSASAQPALLEALFPNDEQTTSILAYFRQLHAGDKLLVNATDVYVAHCSDARKIWWVNERRQHFEALVDSPPVPFHQGATRREVIRMFMYGAGLLHATSNHGDDQKLADLISARGRHHAVAVFNHCLHDLFAVAIHVFHVIRQDYEHWIADHGLAKPDRDDIGVLFQSKTD